MASTLFFCLVVPYFAVSTFIPQVMAALHVTGNDLVLSAADPGGTAVPRPSIRHLPQKGGWYTRMLSQNPQLWAAPKLDQVKVESAGTFSDKNNGTPIWGH
jgi:hypothetical protein